MVAVILLGPSRWRGHPERATTPLETRRFLAATVRDAGVDAFIMEDEPKRPGEDFTDKLERLLCGRDVQALVFYVPPAARRSGMDVEVGAVLQWIKRGWLDPLQVFLLVEDALYEEHDGLGALTEPGNRTWYYHDLAGAGCRLRLYRDPATLVAQMVAIAAEARPWRRPWHAALADRGKA